MFVYIYLDTFIIHPVCNFMVNSIKFLLSCYCNLLLIFIAYSNRVSSGIA